MRLGVLEVIPNEARQHQQRQNLQPATCNLLHKVLKHYQQHSNDAIRSMDMIQLSNLPIVLAGLVYYL